MLKCMKSMYAEVLKKGFLIQKTYKFRLFFFRRFDAPVPFSNRKKFKLIFVTQTDTSKYRNTKFLKANCYTYLKKTCSFW